MKAPTSRPRLLLVEDNVFHQTLAIRLLEKQGYAVRLARDDREAVAAWEQELFELILLDVPIPEMQSLEVVRLIRAREKDTGRHVPIIAMTTHAAPDELARCLTAGVDQCLSRPLRAEELFAALEQVHSASPSLARGEPREPVGTEVIDWNRALKHLSGRTHLLRELVAGVLDEYPQWRSDLIRAIAAGDAPGVEYLAHTLKGTFAQLGADPAADAASRLEILARDGKLEGVAGGYAALEQEADQVLRLLSDFLRPS